MKGFYYNFGGAKLRSERYINYIMKVMPHRYPFLMIDRIVELVPGQYIRGFKNITINEPVFNGHFPGHPVFPGVLIIEVIAQLGGFLFMKKESNGDLLESDLVFICGADRVKFIDFVSPGDRLDIECSFAGEFNGLLKIKGVVKVNHEVVSKAEITYKRNIDLSSKNKIKEGSYNEK